MIKVLLSLFKPWNLSVVIYVYIYHTLKLKNQIRVTRLVPIAFLSRTELNPYLLEILLIWHEIRLSWPCNISSYSISVYIDEMTIKIDLSSCVRHESALRPAALWWWASGQGLAIKSPAGFCGPGEVWHLGGFFFTLLRQSLLLPSFASDPLVTRTPLPVCQASTKYWKIASGWCWRAGLFSQVGGLVYFVFSLSWPEIWNSRLYCTSDSPFIDLFMGPFSCFVEFVHILPDFMVYCVH